MENQISTNQERVPLSWLPKPEDSTISVETSTESVEANLENRRERVVRVEGGKFAPGNCANPLGRPRSAKVISDALKQALAEGKADELGNRLMELTESADRDSVRLAAIQEIADRTEGKA